jgi:hypothetical protein
VKKQRIIDEYIAHTGFDDSAKGNTRETARKNLGSYHTYIGSISAEAGAVYSQRIAPVQVWENRRYFKSAKTTGNKMKFAHRAAQRGNWSQAKAYWQEVYKGAGNEKTAARAAYNLAVANEAENQLKEAIDWAGIAYQNHGLNKAAAYLDLLYHRIREGIRLNQQLEADTLTSPPE